MLTENDVVDTVAEYLKKTGCEIIQSLTTHDHGYDIIAKRPNQIKIYVEAKGATSSKPNTNRFGQEFTLSQVHSHIGRALVKTFQTINDHPDSTAIIALPNNHNHRKVINSMEKPLIDSGIHVWMVSDDQSVAEMI